MAHLVWRLCQGRRRRWVDPRGRGRREDGPSLVKDDVDAAVVNRLWRQQAKRIVVADEELAAIALDEATAGAGDERLIGLARQALDKGRAEATSGRHRQAIDQFRSAWSLARKAVRSPVDD